MEQLLDRVAALIVYVLFWFREKFAACLQYLSAKLKVWQQRMLFILFCACFAAWLFCTHTPVAPPARIVPATHLRLQHAPIHEDHRLYRLDSLRLHDPAAYDRFLRKYPGLADTLARLKF